MDPTTENLALGSGGPVPHFTGLYGEAPPLAVHKRVVKLLQSVF